MRVVRRKRNRRQVLVPPVSTTPEDALASPSVSEDDDWLAAKPTIPLRPNADIYDNDYDLA